MQRRLGVRFRKKQANAVKEHARDRLVIALRVTVHAADAFVEAANDAGKALIEIDAVAFIPD